jgi:hypothetical protein
VKKSIALLMALTLVGGLFATALATSSAAATAKTFQTEFTAFKYRDGQFIGRLAGKRWLCLNGREVKIVKVEGVAINAINAGLRVKEWETGEAKFSKKHPALDIEGARKRRRALHGTYVAKFAESPIVTGYGKTGLCLGSHSERIEI